MKFDAQKTGNRLLEYRKKKGLTQANVAEKAGLSDRTYADIERGTANMRAETLLSICEALGVTPNEILLEKEQENNSEEKILEMLKNCSEKERKTAFRILNAYLDSTL